MKGKIYLVLGDKNNQSDVFCKMLFSELIRNHCVNFDDSKVQAIAEDLMLGIEGFEQDLIESGLVSENHREYIAEKITDYGFRKGGDYKKDVAFWVNMIYEYLGLPYDGSDYTDLSFGETHSTLNLLQETGNYVEIALKKYMKRIFTNPKGDAFIMEGSHDLAGDLKALEYNAPAQNSPIVSCSSQKIDELLENGTDVIIPTMSIDLAYQILKKYGESVARVVGLNQSLKGYGLYLRNECEQVDEEDLLVRPKKENCADYDGELNYEEKLLTRGDDVEEIKRRFYSQFAIIEAFKNANFSGVVNIKNESNYALVDWVATSSFMVDNKYACRSVVQQEVLANDDVNAEEIPHILQALGKVLTNGDIMKQYQNTLLSADYCPQGTPINSPNCTGMLSTKMLDRINALGRIGQDMHSNVNGIVCPPTFLK